MPSPCVNVTNEIKKYSKLLLILFRRNKKKKNLSIIQTQTIQYVIKHLSRLHFGVNAIHHSLIRVFEFRIHNITAKNG